MSVRGEFQRILGDTTAQLRVKGEVALADSLERVEAGAGASLEARAAAVLDGIEAVLSADVRRTLAHLESISRVILGRTPRTPRHPGG